MHRCSTACIYHCAPASARAVSRDVPLHFSAVRCGPVRNAESCAADTDRYSKASRCVRDGLRARAGHGIQSVCMPPRCSRGAASKVLCRQQAAEWHAAGGVRQHMARSVIRVALHLLWLRKAVAPIDETGAVVQRGRLQHLEHRPALAHANPVAAHHTLHAA